MSITTARLIKSVIGLVIVAVLLVIVSNWWGQYRSAASRAVDANATATVDATATPSSEPTVTVGVVLIEGLNFRKAPDSASATIRGFKKGEKLTIVLKKGDWYKVKDSKGVTGWVTAKPSYVKVEK